VQGLAAAVGHGADSLYVAQLRAEDSQLVQAAAAALEGSRRPGVVNALFEALGATSAGRQTWRDARMAVLERIGELGTRTDASRLEPYLTDADPRVAETAADILAAWTGTRPQAAPVEAPRLDLPSIAALDSLANARVEIEVGAGVVVLKLLPWVAPTNAYRFARLARAGYYDGLTFHRVVPNFVVQGGSPHANEYAGDDLYTRDELGLAYNWRGTLGLSTRGRDTGDAQIYINLIDNVRLDHNYTIFAEIVEGMAVVEGLLEGAVIRRITVQ
jgi:cyclophilin family peptidyl-prolyl cis-trans isomerase